MPVSITTSGSATATAYSNQRKIDRTSNGVLWAVYWRTLSGAIDPYGLSYSTDNGAIWTAGGTVQNGSGATNVTYSANASLFIDLDDYAHLAYKDTSNGFIYYRRGTPNAGRTAWTWSAASTLEGGTDNDYPDVVAHREGTGWKAHAVISRSSDVIYRPITITSAGVITVGSGLILGSAYGNTVHKYPSIDFNHTGDGKTIAGGTPHLYVGWSAGATGAGKGIRARRASYGPANTWNWNAEAEIDTTNYVSTNGGWVNSLWDGTRHVIVHKDAITTAQTRIHERNAADNATVQGINTAVDNGYFGSATYDSAGNVYAFGNLGGPNDAPGAFYRKWTRSTNTWAALTTFDASVSVPAYISAKRGYSGSRVEWVYTDGTASPYTITYDGFEVKNGSYVPAMML